MIDFGMRVSVLASSSSGNATYIETPQHHVLVDAGFSGKQLERMLASIHRRLEDIDSVFITHEHSDHIRGVGVLARRLPGLQIYANAETFAALPRSVGRIADAQKHLLAPGESLSLGDLDVESYAVSHDAANPQFYQFHHAGHRFAILTDTGYVSDTLAGTIRDADAYLMEANHDLTMLREGPYPWALKQRILGDYGHLSNLDGADAVMDVMGLHTKRIYLGHLSPHNNSKPLAHATVQQALAEQGLAVGHDFEILDTDPQLADPLFVVGE